MRMVSLACATFALVLALAAPASAQELHSCGNYGFPEGYGGDHPTFTRKPTVGAGVENIRTRVRMLKFRFGA